MDIDLFVNGPPPTTVPSWLLGWWAVPWRGRTFFYFFDSKFTASWTFSKPISNALAPMTFEDTASVTFDTTTSMTLKWGKTGSIEKFSKLDEATLVGAWNGVEPLWRRRCFNHSGGASPLGLLHTLTEREMMSSASAPCCLMEDVTVRSTLSAALLLVTIVCLPACHGGTNSEAETAAPATTPVADKAFVTDGKITLDLDGGGYEIKAAADKHIRVATNSATAAVDVTINGSQADVKVKNTPHSNFRATVELPAATDVVIHMSFDESRMLQLACPAGLARTNRSR